MNSETLVIERLPVSSNQTYIEERAEQTKRGLPKQLLSRRENGNIHQPISSFNSASQEPISFGDGVVTPNSPESRTLAPNVPRDPCYPISCDSSGQREDHTRSSSSEDCRNSTQHPVQTVTTQVLSPDFAHSKRVPGTDQNIYPRAPISHEFQERYSQLVEFFKQAVDAHKYLKHHTSKINYELRLCGSTPLTAVPSIIIYCTEALFKPLRSLLNSRHIRRQYEREKPFLLNKLPFIPSKPHLQTTTPAIVHFKVKFWREATTPTERRSAMEQVVAQSHSFLTMCGSLVRYRDRASTLGLLISVDSKLYGLTVDHLFKSHTDENHSILMEDSSLLSGESDTEDSQADWSWVDDVTYEDLDPVDRISGNGSVTPGQVRAEVTMDHVLAEHSGAVISGHKVDSVHGIDDSTPYLDWALLEFEGEYFERPNAFYLEDKPLDPKFLVRLSAPNAPNTSEVPVFMISGVSGTRKGVMLNSNSYIGGKPGEKLCQAWNLILSGSARELKILQSDLRLTVP
jgi:hypothetical protein